MHDDLICKWLGTNVQCKTNASLLFIRPSSIVEMRYSPEEKQKVAIFSDLFYSIIHMRESWDENCVLTKEDFGECIVNAVIFAWWIFRAEWPQNIFAGS